MKRLLAPLLALVLFNTCSKVPITGRRQLNMLPESMLVDMSLSQYNQFLSESTVVTGTAKAQTVKQVGQKIATQAGNYLKQHGQKSRVEGYNWEFNLVQENVANAWAMPGGKVVVYSGILPLTKTEAGLAAVMGHEIAHAIARHGNERMSQMLALQMGGIALEVAMAEKPEETKQLFRAAYGIGSTVGVMLPYSRLHETEADKMGLIFMAMAGYNPNEAVAFWQRMATKGGAKPPEFLSTHPGDETRIRNLREFMPEAMKYYNKAK